MKKIYLSAKSFNALIRDPDGTKVQRVWTNEFHGLGVDLGKTKKSIIYKYKSPLTNKFRILTLDSYPYSQMLDEDLIDRIVSDHYKIKDKIRADIDPLEEKDIARTERRKLKEKIREAEIAANKEIYTLNNAFDDYTKHRIFTTDISKSTQSMYIRYFNKNISPALGKMPLADLEVGDIEDYLDHQNDATCNISIAILMRLQKVAMRGKNKKIKKPFIFGQERRIIAKRSGTIKDIPAFLNFLQNNEQYTSYHNALHSQLLYGTRGKEIYGLKWSEVNYDEGVINIHWDRVKNRRVKLKQFTPLVIPILPKMAEILEQQKGFSKQFVFPMLRKDKAVTNNIIYPFLKSNGFEFSSHDIRRTVSQTLRSFEGVSMDDIDIVLDHAVSDVNQSYVSGTPLERKRKILSKWNTYLTEIMNESLTAAEVANHG